jgi:hypothetical protein
LVEAARAKGSDGLAWLDSFESQVIFEAKQTHSEGMSIEDEARDVGGLIKILELVFATARRDLANCTNGD